MSRRRAFKFRLYVAGRIQNSEHAMANLSAICKTYLPGRYEIEIIDVFLEPERAFADRVLMTPTLIKLSPSPVRRIVGTLGQTQPVLDALGLEALVG